NRNRRTLVTLIPSAAALALAACASSSGGSTVPQEQAQLTIVGTSEVSAVGGNRVLLAVKYHDDHGPIPGEVSFRLDGPPAGPLRGAQLSVASIATDADGVAQVEIETDADAGDPSFVAVAEAEGATAVDWQVTVYRPLFPHAALVGTYQVKSKFDLVSGIPGT